jgi:hypothetical protein
MAIIGCGGKRPQQLLLAVALLLGPTNGASPENPARLKTQPSAAPPPPWVGERATRGRNLQGGQMRRALQRDRRAGGATSRL